MALAVLRPAAPALALEQAQAPSALTATLTCRQESGPGRVLCEVEIEAERLVWTDVLVIRAPDFARPLRARVAGSQASFSSEGRVRLPLALVASRNGAGELLVRARAVTCRATPSGELCVSHTADVAARVSVGPTGSEG